MSWFYEALLRASKERPAPGKEGAVTISDESGESFLASIESMSSGAVSPAQSFPKIAFPETPSIDHRPATRALELAGQAYSDPFDPSHDLASNGFRHIALLQREESRMVFQTDPHGVAAEQFRLLRRTLRQKFSAGGVLMITSPSKGDGKTLTAVNLCTCLADSGDPTLLVEADVRRPTIGKILGCTVESPGIEDAWAGKAEPRQAIQVIDELSLHTAMVARIPQDPSRLVNGTGVKNFLAWARERFRWVVLDAPPVLPAADVADLLHLVDGALLVIRAQATSRELSKRVLEMLGKRLHGVILNEVTIKTNPYYGYLGQPSHEASPKKAAAALAIGKRRLL